jgi:phosphoglycolate phosphatase-like HAD superfamily hydrolase
MTDNIHISFDLDGTLIDSIPLMKLSWENVSTKLNLGIGWEVYRKNIGLPFSQICKNLSLEGVESEVYDLYFKFNQDNVDKIKPMDGMKEFTEWMDMSNVDWSIITSKPKITTNVILELLDLNPKFLITADDVENGKPCIDGSELLTSQLNNKIDLVYYVGDTTIDHLFAINSGFKFIEFNQLSDSQFILNNRPVISNLLDIKNII